MSLGDHEGALTTQMQHWAHGSVPLMGAVRNAAEALDHLVDDDFWPLPTDQEMLFMS